jgi:acrylyl-CoA reductase (NADPH)
LPTFKAFLLNGGPGEAQSLDWTDVDERDLMDGDVTVAVRHSTINYKDGLALTRSSPVVRRWPMLPGIDLTGTVRESSSEGIDAPSDPLLSFFGG